MNGYRRSAGGEISALGKEGQRHLRLRLADSAELQVASGTTRAEQTTSGLRTLGEPTNYQARHDKRREAKSRQCG